MNWVRLRPKKLQPELRQHGIPGSSYRLLVRDVADYTSMQSHTLEAPMTGFSHDYLPRVEPFRHQLLTKPTRLQLIP